MANVDIIIKTIDQTKAGLSSFTTSLSKVAIPVAAITTAINLMKGAFEFSAEGAKLQRLADAGAEVARQYGGNMDEIVRKIKEASLGTVSEMDIIASANRAMMLGLSADSDKLANLMEVAAFRGRAMGLDTTKAFNDIVTGLGRASPLILDNLGIIVNAKETYKNYAESIGKSASELSKAEKTQALLNAVLEEGNRMLEESGGLALDAAGKLEALDASWKNFIDHTKQAKSEETSGIVVILTKAIDKLDEKLEENRETIRRNKEAMDSLGISYDDHITKAELLAIQEEIGIQRGREASTARWDAIAAIYAESDALNDTTAEYQKYNGTLIDGAIKLTEETEKYRDSQEDITARIAELQAEKLTYYSWETDKIQATQDKIDDLSAKYSENAEEFRAAMEEKFAMMAIEKIAMQDGIEGFSEAEYERARAILETTDVATAAAFEQAQAQELLTTAVADGQVSVEQFGGILSQVMADGVVSVDEVKAAIEGLPDEKTITLNIATNYSAETQAAMELFSAGEKGYAASSAPRAQHASGGSFLIPSSYGNEGFLMGNGDTASGGERVTITPSGGNPNGDIVAALYATRINEASLARSIVEGILSVTR